MVRLKIERHKKYPDSARIRQIEGSVTVCFVITPEGDIKSAEVVRTSGNRALDGAALMAVKDAVPFPKAPASLFKGDIPLELTIVFELT
jgi:protein TonB